MANHLSGRHSSPAGRGVWPEFGESVEQFIPIPDGQQSLHEGRILSYAAPEFVFLRRRHYRLMQSMGRSLDTILTATSNHLKFRSTREVLSFGPM
jgi:hypothetical protein